jgi:hypothetical protein
MREGNIVNYVPLESAVDSRDVTESNTIPRMGLKKTETRYYHLPKRYIATLSALSQGRYPGVIIALPASTAAEFGAILISLLAHSRSPALGPTKPLARPLRRLFFTAALAWPGFALGRGEGGAAHRLGGV